MAKVEDNTLLFTGGDDKVVKVWNSNDFAQPIASLEVGSTIKTLALNNTQGWLAIGTTTGVRVWSYKDGSKLIEA